MFLFVPISGPLWIATVLIRKVLTKKQIDKLTEEQELKLFALLPGLSLKLMVTT